VPGSPSGSGVPGPAKVVGSSVANELGVSSVLSLTVLAAVIGVLISETTSNTATVGIVVPITRMFYTGFVFDLIGVVLVVTGVLLMANLTGLA
jgi:hypothetical protein